MTRTLVYEDDYVRRYEVRDADGDLVGCDEESKQTTAYCPTCGGTGLAP